MLKFILFYCFLIHLSHSIKISHYDIDFGSKYGLDLKSSSISYDTLQQIKLGAENNNMDNIYFLGLLKLYGISLTIGILLCLLIFTCITALHCVMYSF